MPIAAGRRIAFGLAWAMLALAIFSGWFAVTRLVVTGDLRVWDVVALRFGGGTLVLLPVLLGQCRHLPWRAWRQGFVLAFLWGAPFVLFVVLGLQLTSASHASSITPGLMSVFAGVFAWAVFGERPSLRRGCGYGVILAGTTILIFAGVGAEAGVSLLGIASLVLAAAMWAGYTLRLGRGGLASVQAAAFVCFWSAAVYVPLYLISGVSRLPDASLGEIAFQGFYQGLLVSGVAILAYNQAVALLGAVAAAAVTALVPVLATGVARLVLGETPSPVAWLAIAMITAGVALAVGSRRGMAATGTAAEDTAAIPFARLKEESP